MNRFLPLLCLWALLLGGCSVYKVEILQGSDLVFDKAGSLREGQTKEEVRSILGPAHVIGKYRPDSWHYFSLARTTEAASVRRSLTLDFDGEGRLAEITMTEEQVENDY